LLVSNIDIIYHKTFFNANTISPYSVDNDTPGQLPKMDFKQNGLGLELSTGFNF